jgi:hypothetical protein
MTTSSTSVTSARGDGDHSPYTELSVITETGETLQIARRPRPLRAPDARNTGDLKRALRANPRVNLDGDAIEVAAGVFVDAPRVRRLVAVQDGMDGLASLVAGQTELLVVEGQAILDRLLPLNNPRIGHLPTGPIAPPLLGAIDSDGNPLAQAEMRFSSLADARNLVARTATDTLKVPGADYSESILTHAVMTPIEAVLTRLTFDDETTPFVVAAITDGASRATSAMKARMDSDGGSMSVARSDVGEAFAAALTSSPREALRVFRRAAETYNAMLARGGITMRVLRDGKTLTVPLRLVVGAVFAQGSSTEALPAAIATTQSARHITVNPWQDAAQDAMVARRMVGHLASRGFISKHVVRLVDGQADEADAAAVFGHTWFGHSSSKSLVSRGRVKPLWRAVGIVHALTRPDVFEEAKRFIRSDIGLRSVKRERYAGMLGVLIDLPWRPVKPATLATARNAWRDGGVLTDMVMGTWQPIPTDATTLAAQADEGGTDARITLLVAAGTALLADGVLTRDTGSKVTDGRAPYRMTPPALLAALLDTEHGRRQAAAVMDTFDPDRQGGDGAGRSGDAEYTYLLVDARGAAVPDGASVKVLMERDLFDQADPERAGAGTAEHAARPARQPGKVTSERRNELRRTNALDYITKAKREVDALAQEIQRFPLQLSEHPLGTREEWDTLKTRANRLYERVLSVAPPADRQSDDSDDFISVGRDGTLL